MTKIYIFNATRLILLSISLVILQPNLEAQTRKVKKAEKHKEKVDKQEEKKYEKSREAAIKQHYKNQSDATKAQMKESKKKSKQLRKQNKTGFFKSLVKAFKTRKEQKKRSVRQKRK